MRGALSGGLSFVVCGIPVVLRFSFLDIGIALLESVGSLRRVCSWKFVLLAGP